MGNEYYKEQLSNLRNEGLYRQMRIIESPSGRLCGIEGGEKIVFCSNNYLGLANDGRIISAIKKGVEDWGFGSGGSRLICGNTAPHEQLQKRLARMLKKEASLIFPSGYTANNAVLSSLPQEKDLILIDKLVHASLIDGARAGKGHVRTYPHGNLDKLKRLLEKGGYNQAFIVTDSLFSMDGDKADLEKLVELKRQFEAVLMVDEAHAFGCVGPGGKGCAAEMGVLDEVDIYVATFSKALGGAGGFVAGTQVMIDYIVNKSRGFIYTTGIPAVNCIAANAALDIVEQESQRRRRLIESGKYFCERCREMNLDIGESESYIVPIILGEAQKATEAAEQLGRKGFMIPAIRPPTVAPGRARLRVSLMSEHTKEDIDLLCTAIDDIIRIMTNYETRMRNQ